MCVCLILVLLPELFLINVLKQSFMKVDPGKKTQGNKTQVDMILSF